MNKITLKILENFLRNERIKDRTLEYKLNLKLDSEKERFELCRDVAAFANTDGGHIIYGIQEKDGKPKEVVDIQQNIDELKQRIHQILESRIEPKLMVHTIYKITVGNKNCLVIGINKSWNSPHGIKFKGSKYQFPYRTDSGKSYYDVFKLREEIIKYSSLEGKIRDFVENRIHILINGLDLSFDPKVAQIVLHLIPLSTFGNHQAIDVNNISKNLLYDLNPISMTYTLDSRVNLDGILTFVPFKKRISKSGYPRSSVQLFRDASIEARVEVLSRDSCLRIKKIEEDVNAGFKRYIHFISEHSDGPIFVFMNLLNVKGYQLLFPNSHKSKYSLDQDRLNLSNIEINIDDESDKVLVPFFSRIYNACGEIRQTNSIP